MISPDLPSVSSRRPLFDRLIDLCGGPTVRMNEPSGPAALIEELEARLIPRFVAAEAIHFLGSLAPHQRGFLPRIEQLRMEHREMVTELERLLELARTENEGSGLSEHLQRFLDRLDIHERAEQALAAKFIASQE